MSLPISVDLYVRSQAIFISKTMLGWSLNIRTVDLHQCAVVRMKPRMRRTNNFTSPHPPHSSNHIWPVGPSYRCTNNHSRLKKLANWKYPPSQQVCYKERHHLSSLLMIRTTGLQHRDIPPSGINKAPQWNPGAASGGNRRKLKPRSWLCGGVWG